jgi:hypothetical protein
MMISMRTASACAPFLQPDDAIRFAMKLEQELGQLTGSRLRFHVADQELQLFGTVRTWYQKQLVQEAARAAAPDLRIRNEIRVRLTDAESVPPDELEWHSW